jgi:hypothetical protein
MAWGLGNECPLFSTTTSRGVYRSAFIPIKIGSAVNSELKLIWPVPGLGIKVTGLAFHGDGTVSNVPSIATSGVYGRVTSSYASATASIADMVNSGYNFNSLINPVAANTQSYAAPQAVTSMVAFEIPADGYFALAPFTCSYSGGVVVEVQYVDLG